MLPAAYTGDMRGHATQGAALALKARTLLYAASDLHNTTSYAPGYSNPELLGYTTGSQASRWTAAKASAKAVIDLNQFSLYHATPAPGDSIARLLSIISSPMVMKQKISFFSISHSRQEQAGQTTIRLSIADRMATTTGVTILLWEIWSISMT